MSDGPEEDAWEFDCGGPMDGDDCVASAPFFPLPVDAYPVIAALEEEFAYQPHPERLVHMYLRCVVHRAFHYRGIVRLDGPELGAHRVG